MATPSQPNNLSGHLTSIVDFYPEDPRNVNQPLETKLPRDEVAGLKQTQGFLYKDQPATRHHLCQESQVGTLSHSVGLLMGLTYWPFTGPSEPRGGCTRWGSLVADLTGLRSPGDLAGSAS